MSSIQRFTASAPCPICSGHDRLPRGSGQRCAGFVSTDGEWARCTREESAGALALDSRTEPPTYAHRLSDSCKCGLKHGAAVARRTVQSNPVRAGERPRRVVAHYPYRGIDGRVIYEVARTEPKGFIPRHPDASGTMVKGLTGVGARVPYRLPELIAAPSRVLFWPEGEKDCERLVAAGLLATTTHGGAKSFRKYAVAYAENFRGRGLVAVLPDNDDDGRAYASEVATALHAVGAGVRVVQLPGLPVKGDVSDWLDAGHTVDELKELALATPAWTNAGATSAAKSVEPTEVGVLLSDVAPESISWLWPSRLERGKVTLVDGDPGLGKSLLTLDWTARVSTGRAWPDGTAPVTRASVAGALPAAED